MRTRGDMEARPARPERDLADVGRLAAIDPESDGWVRDLGSDGPAHDRAVRRLHELLLRVAHAEAARRRPRLPGDVVGELDDLCTQAASDAAVAVLGKLDGFRGEARFTTWACKFVILELSSRLRRRAWRGRKVVSGDSVLDRLAESAPSAQQTVEHRELLAVLGRAVDEDLTERQRFVFRAAVIDEVPIDVLAERLDSSRGAIYKTVHDARSKLRTALTRAGHGEALA